MINHCSTKKEMAQIKLTGASPGLKLLGFKPISAIRPEHNVTHSTFAFPNDYVSGVLL